MNLQERGMRYILRGTGDALTATWLEPSFVLPSDVDCTDMSDDEFAIALDAAKWKRLTLDPMDCPKTARPLVGR
jgi:hypothetical protein